jgi:hypothetical protein
MKTILLHACAFLALAVPASAVIFGVDAFDYPDGPIAGQSGGVSWDRTTAQFFSPSGGPSNWEDVTDAPTVLLGRLVTNNSAAQREYNGSPEADGAVNETSFSNVVYCRATFTTGPTLPDFFGLSSFDFGSERVFWGERFAQANFGVQTTADGNVASGVAVLPNTAYKLMAKRDFANDVLALWVNSDLTTVHVGGAAEFNRYFVRIRVVRP